MAVLWNQYGDHFLQNEDPGAERKAATSKATFLLPTAQTTPVAAVITKGSLQIRFAAPLPMEILLPQKKQVLDKVLAVFRSSTACQQLVADLAAFGMISSIVVGFADSFPPSGNDTGQTKGDFLPDRPSPEYQVYVVYEFAATGLSPAEQATGAKLLFEGPQTAEPTTFTWPNAPGTGKCNIVYYHVTPESRMIVTLYHELLHVWFVNKYARVMPGATGHRDVFKCEFDVDQTGTSPFLTRLKTIYCEMDKREGVAQPPCK